MCRKCSHRTLQLFARICHADAKVGPGEPEHVSFAHAAVAEAIAIKG